MHLNALLDTRDSCPGLANCPQVSCPGTCQQNEVCSVISQACPSTCAKLRCDPMPSKSSGSSGPSPGALAGAIIGALALLVLVVLGYIWYRRREAAQEAASKEKALAEVKPDIPARADAVLSRPDPHLAGRGSSASEKPPSAHHRASSGDAAEQGAVRVYDSQSNSTINLDPSQRRQSGSHSARSNPFADGVSIQTASGRSQSTNVIPIALVQPLDTQGQTRIDSPFRSPELTLHDNNHLDLEHAAVSDSEMDTPRRPYAASARSGASGVSFMTTSSTASDIDDAPIRQGVVRQVFGVSQAQVVQVPSTAGTSGQSSMPTTPASPSTNVRTTRSTLSPRMPSRASKATIGRSPLAQTAFTHADIPLVPREPTSPTSTVTSRGDPFTDAASPNNRESFADSSRSTDTFGHQTEYHSEGPFTPRPDITFADVKEERPVSIASTVDGGSIRADIGTASRVILGMQSPSAYGGSNLSPGFPQSRATSMQTNGGRTVISVDRYDDEESVRRHSLLSAKTTSSHADSVLAGFPFVPPSPISALPPRSPGSASSPGSSPSYPGSTFARQQAQTSPAASVRNPPLSPVSTIGTSSTVTQKPPKTQRVAPPPVPQSNSGVIQRTNSTFSTSTASGLETYPFQFVSPQAATPSTQRGSRASLDTLALSRDLAAFPLEYERTSFADGQTGRK